eukprot:TRINITY_DN3491_c0_g1_i1.p2 TRINITY_DN3491_c0_g1~~TRINITY_DN3491_c0_g1_i1.p2  ORF type:complete len:253 (+),score=21.85 TRINITY_DN3491_c0_g1_i1:993-1751(+)
MQTVCSFLLITMVIIGTHLAQWTNILKCPWNVTDDSKYCQQANSDPKRTISYKYALQRKQSIQIQIDTKNLSWYNFAFDKSTFIKVIAGSCRAKDDEKRLEELQEYVQSLDLIDHVVFRKNVEWKDLYNEMKQSMIGIHTMQDEHFGIVVVELIAAGLVTIAHNSAGPKYDIIQGNTKGFLAENEEDFAKHVKNVLDHYDDEEMKTLRRNAREHSKTFSDEAFIDKFMGIFEGFMENAYRNKKIKAHQDVCI